MKYSRKQKKLLSYLAFNSPNSELYIYIYMTVFGKTNWLARKIILFIALLPFTSSEDAAVQI